MISRRETEADRMHARGAGGLMRVRSGFAVAFLAFCAIAGPSAAQEKTDPLDTPVRMEVRDVTLSHALEVLLEQVRIKYRMEPNAAAAAERARVSANLEGLPVRAVLPALIRAAASESAITFKMDDGVLVFSALPPPAKVPQRRVSPLRTPADSDPGRITRNVSINLINLDLPDALRVLFEQVNASYAFPILPATSGKVSLALANIPFEEALRKVISLAGPDLLRFDSHGSLYFIGPNYGAIQLNNKEPQILSCRFTDTDVRYALNAIFFTHNVNYTLDQAVQGKLTLKLDRVPRRVALENVLRSCTSKMPLTYRVVEGVYIIGPHAP